MAAAVPPAAVAAVAAAAAAPHVVIFADAPGLIDGQPIDYGTAEGAKAFKAASKELPIKFDCLPGSLKVFLANLQDRALINGWERILNVPEDATVVNGPTRYLLSEYGNISLRQVAAHAAIYLPQQVRARQDSMQLYHCIMSSLTTEAKAKITLYSSEYTIGTQVSGACLLKVVVELATIDTNATARFIRARLSSLDTYMRSVSSDVEKFNQHVKDQVDSLHARGEVSNDLLANLFKGYKAASDREFVWYIKMKESEHDEGTTMIPQRLMQLALNKYKTLTEAGEWNAPSEDTARIIALEARTQKRNPAKSGSKDKKGKTKTSEKQSKATGKGREGKPAWMIVKPKSGESTKKVVNDKDYWWCPKHQAWTRHTPDQCEGKGVIKNSNSKGNLSKEGEGNKGENKGRAMQLTKALAAIVDVDDE
jgi:hypothetical protein